MPQIVQLTASLSIWVYPKDHAPPHFHLIGPDTDAMIDLHDLSVIRGMCHRGISVSLVPGQRRMPRTWSAPGGSSMTTADEDVMVVGDPLPRLVSVNPAGGFEVTVVWEPGVRTASSERVDLAPAILRYKVYAPLRDDPVLFATLHLQSHRFGVAWGVDGAIDMGVATIEDLADETMRSEDFDAFMLRHGFTLDGVAAELGISRRMAAYYRQQHRIPRTVALACRYLDVKAGTTEGQRPTTAG